MSPAGVGSNLGFWLGEAPDCDANCKADIAKGIAEGNLETSAHAMGIVGLGGLSKLGLVTAGIGGSANFLIQSLGDGEVNYTDVLLATWVGGLTSNTGVLGTVGWNMAGGATSSGIKGEDPLMGGATSGAGSFIGYGFGKIINVGTNKYFLWKTDGFDPKYNPKLQGGAVEGQLGLSKDMNPAQAPGILGNAGGALTTENTNSQVQQAIKNEKDKKNETKK